MTGDAAAAAAPVQVGAVTERGDELPGSRAASESGITPSEPRGLSVFQSDATEWWEMMVS